jgi:DNA-binding GntR family transcriptional regulator
MSMTTDAFERIRDAIVSGGLEFGEPLSETQIAKALGMSKAPVRAAFIELKDKGLVTIVPQSGTYVFSPTAEDVRTMSHFRFVLECEAVRESVRHNKTALFAKLDEALARMRKEIAAKNFLAYGAADNAYHLAFLEESGNRYLLRAYDLSSAALEALRVRLQKGGNFRERSLGEHVEMAQMLRTGKVADALKLLRSHVLVINDSLDLLPLDAGKGSRKESAATRDYMEVFARRISRKAT